MQRAEAAKKSRTVIPVGEASKADIEQGKGRENDAPKFRTTKEVKKAIKMERKRIDRVYTFEVQQNPKAQTYLYQPYTYKYVIMSNYAVQPQVDMAFPCHV